MLSWSESRNLFAFLGRRFVFEIRETIRNLTVVRSLATASASLHINSIPEKRGQFTRTIYKR